MAPMTEVMAAQIILQKVAGDGPPRDKQEGKKHLQ
jgi:hypothetical protein